MQKRLAKLLHDWVRVKLDPVGEDNVTPGGIILVEPEMVRTGVVTQTGPGKVYCDGVTKKTTVQVGARVAFFAGNMDTKQGKMLREYLEEDEALIPEDAILFEVTCPLEEMPRLSK
jgi:co-chaperonin GroES (HSP10)